MSDNKFIYNKIKQFNLLDFTIVFLTINYLIVDSFNGYLLRSGLTISISQIYKSLILILMLITILLYSRKYSFYLLLLFTVFLSMITLHIVYFPTLPHYTNNLIFFNKLIFVIVNFIFFKYLVSKNPAKTRFFFFTLFLFSLLVIYINIVLSVLGFGFYQYESQSIGYVGFFYSGNEVSALMIVLTSPLLFVTWGKNKFLYVIFVFALLIFAVLMATKVAIVGTILLIIFIPFIHERNKIFRLTKTKVKTVLLFLLIIIPFAGYLSILLITQVGILEKWVYSYSKFGIYRALLSGRESFVSSGLTSYINDYSFLQMLFGRGYLMFQENLSAGGLKSIEIDFVDILLSYGIVGVIIIYSFWIYLILNSARRFTQKEYYYAPVVFFTNLLLIAISSTAGHVLYSAMIAIPIGFLNAMVFYKKPNNKVFT